MRVSRSFTHGGWIASALISGATFADTACNRQPVQPQSVQAVGQDMIVNGVPTSIVGVEFAGTPNDVSKEFREFWTGEAVPAKWQNGPSGMLISALDGTCLYVLTIAPQRNAARTRGTLSVIRLGTESARHQLPDSVVSLPRGGSTVSDVESRDQGQTGRTWLIEMRGDARENALQYRNELAGQGWSSVGRAPDHQSGPSHRPQGTAFAMQRGNDNLDASFSDQGEKTMAVINVTRIR